MRRPVEPAGWGARFTLTVITNDATLARTADASGVDRIGVDLERLGKAARQTGRDNRLSVHRVEDLAALSKAVRHADLFARLNPLHPETPDEIDRAVAHGARVVMLPYFHVPAQVDAFVRLVAGRATVAALVETTSAVDHIEEILDVPGLDEVTIGLNDLRLELGVASHFEILVAPWLDALAARVRDAGIRLGIGGVAHPADRLPVPPDLVLAQYPRLGARSAWVSRSFLKARGAGEDFAAAIAAIRSRLTEWAAASPGELENARRALTECLHSGVCGRSPEAGQNAAGGQGMDRTLGYRLT
jgi:hypothetical protein